jgi:hypothetical protein
MLALHVVDSACHWLRKQVSLGDIRKECDVEYAGANCEGSTEARLVGQSSQRFSGTPLLPCAHIRHSALGNLLWNLFSCETATWTQLARCINEIKNSMVSVRERTIPTERPPPVSEGANFSG